MSEKRRWLKKSSLPFGGRGVGGVLRKDELMNVASQMVSEAPGRTINPATFQLPESSWMLTMRSAPFGLSNWCTPRL
jgi:hypothetical protein